MRNEFFKLLKNKMHEDESIFLLAADMGLGLVEDIQNEFPDRFLNVGISEQNMIGVASGLCNVGFRPFCYTISNFLIQRAFEQIRNDVCLHNYPITLVGTSTGFDNGLLGPTHQVIDDIGCIKILPNMRIYSPSTLKSASMVFDDVINSKQPAYVRIGKGSYDLTNQENNINNFIIKNSKSDILVITHGTTLENCVAAFEISNDFSIYCMNKIKPFNKTEVEKVIREYSKIIVIEDHMITSGLYDSLCPLFVEMKSGQKDFYHVGPPERYEEAVGDNNYFAEKYGYSVERIVKFISNL
ncbi:conserved hypothetical protein [Candidatus Magnetomoraceae bacterium gMMP-1]